MGCRNIAGEMVAARANGLCLTIRQADLSRRVARDRDIPLQVLQRLPPMALDGAIGRVVVDIGPFAVLNLEGGFQDDVLIGIIAADTSEILIAPGQQIAQQHHMVAAVHRRIGLVTIP